LVLLLLVVGGGGLDALRAHQVEAPAVRRRADVVGLDVARAVVLLMRLLVRRRRRRRLGAPPHQ